MQDFLRKLHNLQINGGINDNIRNMMIDVYVIHAGDIEGYTKEEIRGLIDQSCKLAGDHTVLPMYYLKASTTTGKKQDRFHNFYLPKETL